MSDQIKRPQPPDDAASIIAHVMDEQGVTVQQLADLFGTTAPAIEAILSREVPVPLMWVPVIADAVDLDSKALMTLALGEQWLATLTSIAGTLLWEEGAVQRELVAFFTQLGGGECPSRTSSSWRQRTSPPGAAVRRPTSLNSIAKLSSRRKRVAGALRFRRGDE